MTTRDRLIEAREQVGLLGSREKETGALRAQARAHALRRPLTAHELVQTDTQDSREHLEVADLHRRERTALRTKRAEDDSLRIGVLAPPTERDREYDRRRGPRRR